MTKTFEIKAASAAQRAYCDEHELPQFAPSDGICHRCGYNIYLPLSNGRTQLYGISVEEAGERLITGCPHCNATFCD